jgi:polar amino acid transport system ATP-binding protein/putative ABC transport system ATP-binding protein
MVTAASAETFRRIMSYVPQELSLPSEWVSEMVQMPFGIRANRSVKFSRARLIEEWKKLDLEESLYDSQVSKVSGGQRQRIMLAVSGMLNKPILLVDEPTSALDGTASSHVMDYFRNLAAGGTMIIAVTHDREFAEKCDKIININNGNN